jgi:hypothetical protein
MAQRIPDRDDVEDLAVKPSRRRAGLAVGLLLAILFGYWLSPYVAATRFALAANAGASDEVLARADLPALRAAFARQIVRTYLSRYPRARGLDPLARQVVASAAAAYVDAIIAEHLTPEAITTLLGARGAAAQAGALLGRGVTLPRVDGLGDAWTLFANSGFDGLASFAVAIPPQEVAADGQDAYRLRFGLAGMRWKLRALELPQTVLARLADELKSRTDRAS